jgi:hypothetical protein
MAHQVALLEQVIHNLHFAMRHASPCTVNTLRKYRDELDDVLLKIMESKVVSNVNLRYYIQRSESCMRECASTSTSNNTYAIPKPPASSSYTLPDVFKVNVIFYIDSTESMREDLSENGAVSEAVQSLVRQIFLEMEMVRNTGLGLIDCLASLVWFGDATDGDPLNSYNIALIKENISLIPQALAMPVLKSGGNTLPESGLLAINDTFTSLVEDGYATRVIYVTDSPSKTIEQGASASVVKSLFVNNSAKVFGLFPTHAQPDIRGMFSHYDNIQCLDYSLDSWASKMLRD